MSYGLKYTSQFDSFKPLQGYQVDIFKKDYTGDSTTVLLSGTPVVQEWQIDDPKAPIRGCTLKVSIITDETGVRLLDFYSEDDAGFYVEFKCTTTDQFLFKGYLLQDDCQEIQVDFNHEIALTFTDMLGTLKDITIDVSAETYKVPFNITNVEMYSYTDIINGNRIWVKLPEGNFNITEFTINNSTFLDGNYTVTLINEDAGFIVFTVNETVPISTSQYGDFSCLKPIDLYGYLSLRDVLRLCLKSTLLNLRLNSYVTIFPQGGTNLSTWDDTFIDANTLRVDTNSWMNCYDILEQLMSRFNASLFQSDANWTIVRWDEMYRYTDTNGATIYGNGYDEDFTYTGTITHRTNFTFMNGYDMETGIMKSIERPFQFVKETFNYKQPDSLFKNENLQIIGGKIYEGINNENRFIEKAYILGYEGFIVHGDTISFSRDQTFNIVGTSGADGTYTTLQSYDLGNGTFALLTAEIVPSFTSTNANIQYLFINKYVAQFWYDSTYVPPYFNRYIYISTDFQFNEVERYLVIEQTIGGAGLYAAKSNDIELSQGDLIKIYFDFRSEISQSGPAPVDFAPVITNDGINKLWISTNGIFLNNAIFTFTFMVQSGDNTNQWHTAEIVSNAVPYDCILNLYLRGYPNTDMYYKNFRIEIINSISGSRKIIGHTHQDIQNLEIKNNIDKDIFLDNSPRSTIKGTLFLESNTLLLRDKCISWGYPLYFFIPIPLRFSYPRLGQGTTQESLFTRFKPRAKYEGTFLSVLNGDGPYNFINPLSVFKYYYAPNLYRFVPGKMAIDYKNANVNLTLFELLDTEYGFDEGMIAEYKAWLQSKIYEFNYLYENK